MAVRSGKWQNALDKVVPQHTCWVLQHTDKGGDFDLIVLYGGACLAVDGVRSVELPQIDETGKTPITLFCDETVVGV